MCRTIIQMAMLPMLDARQGLSPRRLIAVELIGDEYPWYVCQAFEQHAKERFRSLLVASWTPQEQSRECWEPIVGDPNIQGL
jgi:hypothetical protein